MLRVLLATVLSASLAASEYHVLVLAVAEPGDDAAAAALADDAGRLNGLHEEHPTVRPYYAVLALRDRRRALVFGWRGAVQGVVRADFPATEGNLASLRRDGGPRYPDLRWVPVEEVRAHLPP